MGKLEKKKKKYKSYNRRRIEARWHKAVQHLREDGQLVNDMKDIPALLRELNRDLDEECATAVGEDLLSFFLTKGECKMDESVCTQRQPCSISNFPPVMPSWRR